MLPASLDYCDARYILARRPRVALCPDRLDGFSSLSQADVAVYFRNDPFGLRDLGTSNFREQPVIVACRTPYQAESGFGRISHLQ